MKGFQSKCLIASAASHALLLGLVFIGSAFIPHRKPEETVSFELVAIPSMLIDEPNMVGGGNPKAGMPDAEPAPASPVVEPPARQSPAPTQPEPKPIEPVKPPERQPEPKNEVKPEARPEKAVQKTPPPDATPKFNLDEAKKTPAKPAKDDSSANSKSEPVFDFGSATRKTIAPRAAKSGKGATEREERGDSGREAQLASALGQGLSRIQRGLSSGVGEIGIPGPGGAAYASYNLALSKFYEEHWITPQAYSDNEPIVVTEVTIQGDGTVLSARILRKSGKRQLDDSVQKTLDRVKKVPPFPSGNKDEKRTFKINFNLSSKLNIG